MMTGIRERLPNRHDHEAVRFRLDGFEYVATLARFDDGRPAEVFVSAGLKHGSALQHHLDIAAIAVSLALQHGASVDVLRRALKFGALYQALSYFDGGPIKAVTL
jgi:hypothetical protein